MLDLLKKIGLPATLAAVIASLIVMVPLAFTFDERYAKQTHLKESVSKLEAENDSLRHELAQAVGFQQAMLLLIQGKIRPTSLEGETDFNSFMIKVQAVVAAKPPVAAASAASAPASAASAVPPKKNVLKRELEKPMNWKELQDGLYRQQLRLMKD